MRRRAARTEPSARAAERRRWPALTESAEVADGPQLSVGRIRVSPATTTSPRPVARCFASTLRGCSRRRPAPATGPTPRTFTNAGRDPSPRCVACLRRRVRGKRTSRHRNACAGSPRASARCGTRRPLDGFGAYRAEPPDRPTRRALEPLSPPGGPTRCCPQELSASSSSDATRGGSSLWRLRPPRGLAARAGRPDRAAPRPVTLRLPQILIAYEGCGPTSQSSVGPTSRRSMTCGSPGSGCATRSSSVREALGRRGRR